MTTRTRHFGLARLALRALSLWVPGRRRAEWLEEWSGELVALARLGRSPRGAYPGVWRFVAGAVPHALWMRKEERTMESVAQDLGFAARVLKRSPGFTTVAALTLALGIGANASIFSLVNGLVLRPPGGLVEPERLIQIARSYDEAPRWDNWSSPALALIGSEAARTLSGVAGYQDRTFVLGRGADTEQVSGQHVTGGYFDVLGIRPWAGRLLRPDDDRVPGAHPVVVLSHGLWQRRFGGDADVLGRTIELGAHSYEVVGVAPPGFAGPDALGTPPELWVPTMQHPGFYGDLPFEEWGFSWLDAVGRLAEGVTIEEARASMDVVTSRLRGASPTNEDIRVLVAEGVGLDPEERSEAGRISTLLLGIAGLVLLLTCTNVANLFLARAAARAGEVGVRKALGAGRGRLTRQLVTESLLLAALATALAVPLVAAVDRFLPSIVPYPLTVSLEADARVWAFLAVVGLATGLLFGAAPAWAASRGDVAAALRLGRQRGTRARSRLRSALVVAQLALSLGLVTGAALLGRSVRNARAAEPGFLPAGLIVGFADLDATGRYDAETGLALQGRLQVELERIPGVRSVTLANQAPIAGGHARASVGPPGREDARIEAEYIVVGDRYFETLGIPVTRGRPLAGPDAETERVVVVNDALARAFWPGQNPLGQQLEAGGLEPWRVVGVVPDVQMRSLRATPNPAVYYPLAQAPSYTGRVVIQLRADGAARAVGVALREAVARVDPELPVSGVTGLQDALAGSMGETRTIGLLVGLFAGLALLLAAVGLYGVVSFGVTQRVQEMGIRLALGADPSGLVRLVLRQGMAMALLGTLGGLGVSILVGRAFRGLLFGVPPADPATLAGAALVLVGTALVAAWIPARRASRVDAVVSLRAGEAG